MSYLELLKLASPEAVVVLTALVVLSVSLAAKRAAMACAFVATLGIVIAIGAVVLLPLNETLYLIAATNASISVLVRFSVVASRKQSFSSGYH